MKLQVNGEAREFASPLTLAQLVEQLGIVAGRVAAQLNDDIISRSKWPETPLAEGDRVEIVHFVGGGKD
jgi:thiamine biosynthesis protein ThiS